MLLLKTSLNGKSCAKLCMRLCNFISSEKLKSPHLLRLEACLSSGGDTGSALGVEKINTFCAGLHSAKCVVRDPVLMTHIHTL